ncbi:MAG: TIGR04282 family arsenosugar biosynthesis glycosyltransferase [Acidobacteria bacterium]|nr:TIGR04282 family arsenosugar biosynthesis glycosyltransferase [Acidobacteriota bacterium]
MAKDPRAGSVKTRLVPRLTQAEAAELAICFLRDTVLNVQRVIDHVMVAYTPADARSHLEMIAPSGLLWFEQTGRNLGERLESVAIHVSDLGFCPFVILGADSPTLPTSFIQQALEVLIRDQTEIALGPTADGGYYLVGLNSPVPGLFHNIDWSTPLAYEQTATNATAFDLRLHALPKWYDIDTPADLCRLCEEMSSGDDTTRTRAPETYRWLIDRAFCLHKYQSD